VIDVGDLVTSACPECEDVTARRAEPDGGDIGTPMLRLTCETCGASWRIDPQADLDDEESASIERNAAARRNVADRMVAALDGEWRPFDDVVAAVYGRRYHEMSIQHARVRQAATRTPGVEVRLGTTTVFSHARRQVTT
jgi:hypothetical protein